MLLAGIVTFAAACVGVAAVISFRGGSDARPSPPASAKVPHDDDADDANTMRQLQRPNLVGK